MASASLGHRTKGSESAPPIVSITISSKGRQGTRAISVVKDGGEMIKVEKENFDPLFEQLFGDCPAMQEELAMNPDLKKFKNFMILAEVYNRLCAL